MPYDVAARAKILFDCCRLAVRSIVLVAVVDFGVGGQAEHDCFQRQSVDRELLQIVQIMFVLFPLGWHIDVLVLGRGDADVLVVDAQHVTMARVRYY